MNDQRDARMDWSARHVMLREYRVSAADWAAITKRPRAARIDGVRLPDGTIKALEFTEIEPATGLPLKAPP